MTVQDRWHRFGIEAESPRYHARRAELAGSSLGLGLAPLARVARARGGQVHTRDREVGGAGVGLTVRIDQGDR